MTPSRRLSARRRALTLAEVVMATVVVGLMLVAALDTVGAAQAGIQKIARRQRAALLAQQLVAEILQQAYHEPGVPGSFGRGTGESATSRVAYDDVDDYDGYTESPCKYKDDSPIPDTVGWRRTVSVAYVSRTGHPWLPATGSADTGIKRIDVLVSYNTELLSQLVAYRTSGWVEP